MDTSMPIPLNMNPETAMVKFRFNKAAPYMITSGYMNIRCTQHNSQGVKPFISEKYKLPNNARSVCTQIINSMVSFGFSECMTPPPSLLYYTIARWKKQKRELPES